MRWLPQKTDAIISARLTESGETFIRKGMEQNRLQPPFSFRRFSSSQLSDMVYGIQEMSDELAELIRILRRDYQLDYYQLGFYLFESNKSSGTTVSFGKALVDIAARKLNDNDPHWT